MEDSLHGGESRRMREEAFSRDRRSSLDRSYRRLLSRRKSPGVDLTLLHTELSDQPSKRELRGCSSGGEWWWA